MFAISGACHTAITPDADEANAVKAFAEKLGIDFSRALFVIESCDRFLPCADPPELDVGSTAVMLSLANDRLHWSSPTLLRCSLRVAMKWEAVPAASQ
jgi:hypothetical protein